MANLTVTVDLDKLGINDQLAPQVVNAVQSSIQASLAIIRDRWQTEVQNKLNSTRPLYLQGLQWDSVMFPYDGDMFSGAVVSPREGRVD